MRVPDFLYRVKKIRNFYYAVKLYPKRVKMYGTLFPWLPKYRALSRQRVKRAYEAKYGKFRISHGRRMAILKRDGFRCLKCGSRKNLTIDHIVPQSQFGGSNTGNLQTLCEKCNIEKKNETIDYRPKVISNGVMTE